MPTSKLTLPLQILIALMLTPITALAQDTSRILEEVIVTGTPGGGEIRKLDASFAITNVTEEDIRRFAPKSTADLLRNIPGVWAESSGGVSGANVFVRGFPASGDAPFLTLQIEGAPVYPPPTLSFLENTTLFRIDETVERMEGLRGGPQSIQDNGQPGLTTNFLLKEGGDEVEGLVKYTTSDYDLQRFDAVMSGPLDDGLYYMIGGYVKATDGIRDAGYTSEKGNQFTVKLTKELDSGTISGYYRTTDDKGTWYLPGALNAPKADDSEYTQVGTLNRKGSILVGPAGPDQERRSTDLEDGRGWDGSVSGINFDFEIDDQWSISNALNYTNGDADTLGLVPNGGAVNVGDLLADPATDPNAVVTGPLTGTITGRAIGDQEYIQQFGIWEVRKDIESFTNNLALTGRYDKLDVTLGFYVASTSIDEKWALGNQDYYVVERGGEHIDGIACNVPEVDSCPGGFNYDINADGDADSTAGYLAVAYRVLDELSLDVGVRLEKHEVDYSVDEGLDGVITKYVKYDEDETSYTAGANWDIGQDQGIFGRYSKGYKFPYFDDFRDNYDAFQAGEDLIKDVDQYELGYKAGFDTISAYLTLFYNEVKGDTFVARPGAPVQTFTNEAYGLEVDAHWYHESGFHLAVNATIQETEIKESPDNDGNDAQRQPPWQVRLTPSYDHEFSNGMSATVYGTFTAVDDRYSDNANTVTLDGYETVDLGVIFNYNDQLSLQIVGHNLNDEDALTEGDPRNPEAPNGRFIMPRTYEFSISYSL
jgi:iron complex outermembrane receptor protein